MLLPDLRENTKELDLLMKLLVYDPNRRLAADAALMHNYFKDHKTMHKDLTNRYSERKAGDESMPMNQG